MKRPSASSTSTEPHTIALATETCHRLLPVAERQAREGKPSLLNGILDFLRPREETVHVELRHGGPPPRLQ